MNMMQKRQLNIGDSVLWLNPEDEVASNEHIIIDILTESKRIECIESVLILRSDIGDFSEVIATELQ
jgi:hypothetical protein